MPRPAQSLLCSGNCALGGDGLSKPSWQHPLEVKNGREKQSMYAQERERERERETGSIEKQSGRFVHSLSSL